MQQLIFEVLRYCPMGGYKWRLNKYFKGDIAEMIPTEMIAQDDSENSTPIFLSEVSCILTLGVPLST
jgi:hypothetical protein